MTDEFTLTAKDRCDACSARAYWRFVQADYASEWLFCGHHGAKYEHSFPGSLVFDERAQLNVKLDASA